MANRSRGSLFRIGCAHSVAPLSDGSIGFQHHRKYPAGAHEFGQLAKKWPLLVHRIKSAGFFLRQSHRLYGDNPEPRLVNARQNFSLESPADRIRLDNRKCPLNPHKTLLNSEVTKSSAGFHASASDAKYTSSQLQPSIHDLPPFRRYVFPRHSSRHTYLSRFPAHR